MDHRAIDAAGNTPIDMSEENTKKQIKYKYVIPDNLKDCYVNGVWGSVNAKGELHMIMFSERLPAPTLVVHDIDDNKVLSEPSKVEVGGDILRLAQASVVMDIRTAVTLHEWLGERIKSYVKMSGIKNDSTDD